MNIEQIKAAVDAARERQAKELQGCPVCESDDIATNFAEHNKLWSYMHCNGCRYGTDIFDTPDAVLTHWNNRPAQEQADTALLALWEECQHIKKRHGLFVATLEPVVNYGAELYHTGKSPEPMPIDVLQRLASAEKLLRSKQEKTDETEI